MAPFQLASVLSPNVEIEVGGQIVRSKAIHNTNRNPNFSESVLFFDIVSTFSGLTIDSLIVVIAKHSYVRES